MQTLVNANFDRMVALQAVAIFRCAQTERESLGIKIVFDNVN